jgi:hypothetical protein
MPWRRQTPHTPRPTPGPEPELVWPTLENWASALDVSGLSEKTAQDAERFLRDYRRMVLPTRYELALRLRTQIEAQVTPPPPVTITAMDVIATVLSARRKLLG